MARYINVGVTPKQLTEAMKGESEARLYYERLIRMAPNKEEAEIISNILEDELKHFKNFKELYKKLTGCEPVLLQLKCPTFTNYIEGIEKAILDELEAYDFYRDIYLSTRDPYVRDIFFEALTDENEHAAHLNYLFTKNKCGSIPQPCYMKQMHMNSMMPGITYPMCPWQ